MDIESVMHFMKSLYIERTKLKKSVYVELTLLWTFFARIVYIIRKIVYVEYTMISLRISGLDDLASVELSMVVEGLQRTKCCQRRDRRWPAKPPPMAKLVWSYQVFGKKSQKNLTFLGFRQVLYIEVLEAVTCPNNFPKICGIQGARS